ncbi:MAG: nuclear transport factor 2 family protein [Pseudomonadales bacterium]|nr:nuclear transport factor 2 family protein [Pseudomonadales bacterium]
MRNDEQEVSNLLFTYTHRFDEGDFEGAATLFQHAQIIVGALGETVDYLGLLENWRRMVMLCDSSGMPRTMHTCTNVIININLDDGTARARSYYVVYQQTDSLPLQAIVAGRYVDTFELVEEQWRFSQRDYRLMEIIGNIDEHLHHSKLIMAQQIDS